MLKVWKKLWEPFGSCLLNSTANPAKLGWKWARWAVLFSRYLPNGSHDFFQTFSIYFLDYFIKNPQTTTALPFLTHNISAIGGVRSTNTELVVKNLKYLVTYLTLCRQVLHTICPFRHCIIGGRAILSQIGHSILSLR